MRPKSNILLPLFLLVLAGLLTGCANNPQPEGASRIDLADCQLSSPGTWMRLPARCGTLAVYEDRQAASGRQIHLNVAVIPAVSRNPEPDPLFFLTGGPGQAATESYLQVSFAFDRIQQKRDIILVDQRGTGKSNPLTCPQLQELAAETGQELDFAPALEACLKALDADPRFYTTSLAMQDLDQVRAALGYEQINIYGVSYGTRATLTYLKLFPDRVRSMILDGVVPQDEPLGLDVARDAQRALDLMFERCAAEPTCQAAFPSLHDDFRLLFARLSDAPVLVKLPDPATGEMTQITFSADEMGSAVRLLSYAPETISLLPLLIHNAAQKEEYGPLAAQYLIVANQLETTISEGMNYSVLCAEDVPFIDPAEAAAANQGTYLDDQQIDGLEQICATWPRGDIPAGFHQPPQSDAPVLLLSGQADPVTPPENGAKAAATLPNSLQLVAPGQGHNIIFRGCLPRLAALFIENGSVQGLDTSCASEISPMPFFVNFNGPRP